MPHLTVLMGASYGAGNYGMSGRAYDPRFLFSWPNSHIAVMGPRQLAGVLKLVGAITDESAVEEQIERQSNAFYATGRGWDDGIIDPRDTRHVLGLALAAVANGVVAGTRGYGVFRM